MRRGWTAPWPRVRSLAVPLSRPVNGALAPCTKQPELFDPESAKETTAQFALRLKTADGLCAGCGDIGGCLESAIRNRLSGVFAGRAVVGGVVQEPPASPAADGTST